MVDVAAFRRFEAAVHDRMAASYRELFAPVTALAIQPMLDAALIGPGTVCLDIATGAGGLASAARERGAVVTAIDLSPAMADALREREPDIEVVVGSADDLPFPSGSMDAATMGFGIGHLPLPETGIAEAARVLTPESGRLALSWWASKDENRINGLFVDIIGELGLTAPADQLPEGPPIFRFSDPAQLTGLLGGAGFRGVEIETIHTHHHVADAEQWWQIGLGAFARVSTILAAQPQDKLDEAHRVFTERAQRYAAKTGIAIPIAFHVARGQR